MKATTLVMRGNHLPLGGSMVPKYVFQLLFGEKSQNCKNSTTTKAREKIKTALESLKF
jgi:hypothetical protein